MGLRCYRSGASCSGAAGKLTVPAGHYRQGQQVRSRAVDSKLLELHTALPIIRDSIPHLQDLLGDPHHSTFQIADSFSRSPLSQQHLKTCHHPACHQQKALSTFLYLIINMICQNNKFTHLSFSFSQFSFEGRQNSLYFP